MMQLHETNVFVGSGDSPDDRGVKFTMGHVDKKEFSEAAVCAEKDVKHVFALMEETNEMEEPDFAWWNPKAQPDQGITTAVTMVFT